jgi:putative acetyltransferase
MPRESQAEDTCGQVRRSSTLPPEAIIVRMRHEAPFPAPVVTIASAAPTSEAAVALIHELDADLQRRYPGSRLSVMSPTDLSAPHITFLVASVETAVAGCGAVRLIGPRMGEIKRMYVRPEFRGLGVARAMLVSLEAQARHLGCDVVRLETGSGQPEAMALYASAGYDRIAAFGEHVGREGSRCFEKRFD